MKGYVMVDDTGMRSQKEFDFWINLCLEFNSVAKSSKRRKNNFLNKQSKVNYMTNSINWFEIPVKNFDRAKRFYASLLGADISNT